MPNYRAMASRLAWITVAPVKGLALSQREEVQLEPFGVREDRRFHLIDAAGRLLNGKQYGELFQVSAEWNEEAGRLALTFPGGNRIAGVVELGEPVTTLFYGRPVEGRLVAGPWSEALSTHARRPLRLVQPLEPGAGVDRDGGGVTLLSTASLEALRTAAGIAEQVDPRRFRMLLGVDGAEAHEEDSWVDRRVRVGAATVLVRGNVGRCVVTSRHPDTGVRNLPTLDVIADYRDGVETTEPLPFGVWAEVAEPGRVRLGDPVEPLA